MLHSNVCQPMTKWYIVMRYPLYSLKYQLNLTFSETDLDHSDAEIQIRAMKDKLDMRKREQAKLKKQLKKSENNYEKQRELKGKNS